MKRRKKNKVDVASALIDLNKKSSKKKELLLEEMVINDDFMYLISQLMKEKGIKTNAQLAERLKVSPAYISKLFSSDKYFNVPLLAKLQEILDVQFSFVTSELLDKIRNSLKVEIRDRILICEITNNNTPQVINLYESIGVAADQSINIKDSIQFTSTQKNIPILTTLSPN